MKLQLKNNRVEFIIDKRKRWQPAIIIRKHLSFDAAEVAALLGVQINELPSFDTDEHSPNIGWNREGSVAKDILRNCKRRVFFIEKIIDNKLI
jgi:hypothetical protein